MKRFFYILFFSYSTLIFYGQKNFDQVRAPGIYLPDGSKLNEYKKTFEVKNDPNPDPVALAKVDMSKYWKMMHGTSRVEVLDDVTGLTLILYSHSESKSLIDFNSVLIVMPNNHIRGETKNP